MLNKNNILYIFLIGSLLFIFFNNSGIISLMKKQSVILKQQNEIQNLNNEIQNWEYQIENIKRIDRILDSTEVLNPNDSLKLEKIRKEKGVINFGEELIIIKENKKK